jgi:hypothetical protein
MWLAQEEHREIKTAHLNMKGFGEVSQQLPGVIAVNSEVV